MIGVGKSFKYEFDWSKARIPALAAVSPNLETGPELLLYLNRSSIRKLTLDQCSSHALVVPQISPILIQSLGCRSKRGSEAVLIVHNCSKWLKNSLVLVERRERNFNTIRSKTCRTIAAAPLRPPPSALLRAAPKSNYIKMSASRNLLCTKICF